MLKLRGFKTFNHHTIESCIAETPAALSAPLTWIYKAVRGVQIWVFLHVPTMPDIDSTKNTDNRYSLPVFLLVIKQKDCPSTTCEAILHAYSGSGLGFYYVIQTIMHQKIFMHTPMKP